MQLIRYPQKRSLQQLKHRSVGSCVTIGNFDGVHLGHQALISKVVKQARKSTSLSVVVSMQPLPLQYFNGSSAVEILTQFKDKYRLLKQLGVDVWCNLNFNQRLANMSAEDFYHQVIHQGLQSNYVLVGDDFKFGVGRQGDFKLLQKLAAETAVEVEKMPTFTVCTSVAGSEQQLRVSSTAVRAALRAGDFAQVKAMLGRGFSVSGRVAHGQKLGRELGYPTINIGIKNGAFSLHGIYVVEIIIADSKYPAVASVGFNPSVGGNAKRIEVYVLDFDQQVYGQWVEVLFYKKLRNEVEFDSLNALRSAIGQDVQQTKEYFNRQLIP